MHSIVSDPRGQDASRHGFRYRSAIGNTKFKARMTLAALSLSAVCLIAAGCSVAGFLTLDAVFAPSSASNDPSQLGPGRPDFLGGQGAKLVGRWVSEAGIRILVSKSGAVWADDGDLLGQASLDANDKSRLVFAGTGFRCAYQVRFHGADRSNWVLVDHSANTTCPSGWFERPFMF